jgi:RNA polymerase sigma factor (sigma-70 family)
MAQKTDLELVEEFKQGKIEGFNELVRRYQEKVYWIARRVIGNHDDADDIVQDIFVRVYGALENFRSESKFYTWLYRIAMNLSLNALRKKKIKTFIRYDDLVEQLDEGRVHADEHILKQEYQTVLEKAIERLPAKQKIVFIMRYYDEMPYEEMAKVLKKSVGGLKANYFFAFQKIQKYVRKEMES